MDQSNEDLKTLETLLSEFFTGAISNDRRREIELLLKNWLEQIGSWKRCFEFLHNCDNPFVVAFCLNALETTINRQWMALSAEDHARMKKHLYQYSLNTRLQTSTVSKVVKLVVDMGRLEWPYFYPEFFADICGLLQREESASLGLLYLLTTSQEFGCPAQGHSAARSAELQKLLLRQLPDVFSTLTGFLTSERVDSCLTLQVLNHFFSWVPAEHIPQPLVTTIFRLALDVQNSERALLALSTLNEMLYRHWTPPCWQQFLEFILAFLQTPTDNLDKMYLEKMCDLLRLVLAGHMSRGAENMAELLRATLRLTEMQRTVHPGLTTCLHIWSGVMDHPNANKYGDILVKLAELVVNRMQWNRGNELQLSTEDDYEDYEDGKEGYVEESPWQRALRPCLEIVAKVAELQPQPVLNAVVTQWVELCQSCRTLSPDNPRAVFLLRDLASLTRTIGRLSPTWSEVGSPIVDVIRPIVSHLLTLSQLQYHSLSDAMKLELLSVHCEAFGALKACCYWLPHLTESELADVTLQLMGAAVAQLQDGVPRRLHHCAAHLFLTLTSTVTLPHIWTSPPVRPLYDVSFSHLAREDGYLVAGALLNCLILPNSKTEPSELREEQAAKFTARLSQALNEDPVVARSVVDTLALLSYLVRLYKSEGSKQKKLLCTILKNPADRALALFHLFKDDPAVAQEILQFFFTILECLQTQVGAEFVQGAVNTFLSAFSEDRLRTAIIREDGGGLQQFLGMLDLVMQTPALSGAGLTPLTVHLCSQLSNVIPFETVSPTVHEAYYNLVYSILEHKWQYLGKRAIESAERLADFSTLLRTISASLLLPDINLFRLNLSNLEKLNQRWKLYSTGFFKKELMNEVISVLLTTLLNKTHALLADEIALSLCHLINSDPEVFFSLYLPSFLATVHKVDAYQRGNLLSNFAKDVTDLPSLTKNIFRLVNDIANYQVCNAGQPA